MNESDFDSSSNLSMSSCDTEFEKTITEDIFNIVQADVTYEGICPMIMSHQEN